jgi:2-dehydro-3-deoxyphosphogluconate aldolase/(4S)-4-hydroxy-2-oxoglutarate aldolase
MNDIISLLGGHRVIPVVVIDDADHAEQLADALVAGGLPLAEVTFRTPAAEAALRRLAARSDMVVGAGSVRTPDHVDRAVDAGARFVVSPGLSDAVVSRCRTLEVPILPGVASATEIMRALDLGIDVVKLFPAGTIGGPEAARHLSAPFPSLRLVPTGGVGRANLADYLSISAVAAVGGSWMVARDLIRDAHFDEIRRLTADTTTAVAS